MTGFLNKVKEAVTHDKHEQASYSTNAGPHDSNMANKADPRVDSDHDGRLAHGTTGTTTGMHTGMNTGMNNTNTFAGNEYGGAGSTNAGHHNTNMGNKMDPRIDSDLDGRAAHGNSGYGHTGVNTGMNTGITTTGNAYGATGSTNAGPHNSNMMNKADPRVDSDLDGRAVHGNTAHGNTGMATGAAATGTTYGSAGSTNAGPHNTNMGNKMDPRIDSDLDGRANHRHSGYDNTTGATTGAAAGAYAAHETHGTHGAHGAHGTHSTHGTHDTHNTHNTHNTHGANNGPHNSKLMNKLDPRVDTEQYGANTYDSNTYNSTTHGSTTHGTNHRGAFDNPDTTTKSFEQSQTESTPTSTTAHGVGSSNHGPHNSNMMNKLDPRVDSDRDHRATHGGVTGHSAGTTGTTMGTGAMGTGATGATGATGTGHGHYNREMEAGAMGAGAAGVANTHGHHSRGMGTGAVSHNTTMANEMDPRFDSGMTGQHYNTRSTNAGPHDSIMANKVDPRIDSDMDNRARHQQMGTVTGVPAGSSYANTGVSQSGANTAGPHNSNLLNKLDPRVDSDLDNSRTVGSNQRHY